MIRAPEITNALMLHKVCYVYHKDNVLFILPCDALLGFTPGNVTVRQGNHAITFNNTGLQVSIATIR